MHLIIASISGITYIYWAALYTHLFGAVAWLGGILFLTGVTRPIFEYYGADAYELQQRIKVRFLGFTWMMLWTVVVTGVIVLLWSTRFIFFDFSTLWLVLAHVKILLFLILAGLSVMLRSSYKEIENARSEKEGSEDLSPREIILWRIRMVEQFEVWSAIIILLVVSLMQVY